MELSSIILVVSKDVGQMVQQTSVSTNSIKERHVTFVAGFDSLLSYFLSPKLCMTPASCEGSEDGVLSEW